MKTLIKGLLVLMAAVALGAGCNSDERIDKLERDPGFPGDPVPGNGHVIGGNGSVGNAVPVGTPIFENIEFDTDYTGSALAIPASQWAMVAELQREKEYLISRTLPRFREQYEKECLGTCEGPRGNIKARFIIKCVHYERFYHPVLVVRMFITVDLGNSELQEIYDFWSDSTGLNTIGYPDRNLMGAWVGNSSSYGWNPDRLNLTLGAGGILVGTIGNLLAPDGDNQIRLTPDFSTQPEVLPEFYRSFVGTQRDCEKQIYRDREDPRFYGYTDAEGNFTPPPYHYDQHYDSYRTYGNGNRYRTGSHR
ncbi:hypothetical protein ACFLRA_02445 [Bdellovibrionota bacterium]